MASQRVTRSSTRALSPTRTSPLSSQFNELSISPPRSPMGSPRRSAMRYFDEIRSMNIIPPRGVDFDDSPLHSPVGYPGLTTSFNRPLSPSRMTTRSMARSPSSPRSPVRSPPGSPQILRRLEGKPGLPRRYMTGSTIRSPPRLESSPSYSPRGEPLVSMEKPRVTSPRRQGTRFVGSLEATRPAAFSVATVSFQGKGWPNITRQDEEKARLNQNYIIVTPGSRAKSKTYTLTGAQTQWKNGNDIVYLPQLRIAGYRDDIEQYLDDMVDAGVYDVISAQDAFDNSYRKENIMGPDIDPTLKRAFDEEVRKRKATGKSTTR